MKITMQKLNMVKYARSEADVEALEKKGFQVVGESVMETAETLGGEELLPDTGEEENLPGQQPKKGRKKKDGADGDGEPG